MDKNSLVDEVLLN